MTTVILKKPKLPIKNMDAQPARKENYYGGLEKKVPQHFLVSLKSMLNKSEKYQQFEKHLNVTSLTVEQGDYHIPIHSIEHLKELRDYLNNIKLE